MRAKTSVIIGVILLIAAFLVSSGTITGAAITTNIPFTNILSFALVLAALIVFATGTAEVKETKKLEHILFKDKRTHKIKMADKDYFFGRELGHPVDNESAQDVLKEIHEKFKDPELKEVLSHFLQELGKTDALYKQRDSYKGKKLEKDTPEFVADQILKEIDPNFKEFEQKNKYLSYSAKPAMQTITKQGAYDTRELLPLMEKNIENFKVADKTIGSHDVYVEYRGARFRVFAGSGTPYETSPEEVRRILREEIAQRDYEHGDIKQEEIGKRVKILEKYIFK